MEYAKTIVAEFEDVFGKLSATERDWLTRKISDIPLAGALQRIRDFPFCGETDKFALRSIAREALGEIGNERV